jgi:hypothetical protein
MRAIIGLLAVTALASCSIAPYYFPKTRLRENVVAIDATRVTVKAQFRYSPSLTSYVLPAGEYLPVRRDSMGTYYESPYGVLVLPVVSPFIAPGGIYRRSDTNAHYQFAIYCYYAPESSPMVWDLHSMWGLNLNDKIECSPPFRF